MNVTIGIKLFQRWEVATVNINVDLASLLTEDSPARRGLVRGVKGMSKLWVAGMTA